MSKIQRLDSGALGLSKDDFLELLAAFHQMRETEWKHFVSDPRNAETLRHYGDFCDRLKVAILLPLLALLAGSIAAGSLLVGGQ